MDLTTILKENYIEKEHMLKYKNIDIFIISDNNNNPWFNANSICIALKYKNARSTIINCVTKENKKAFSELKHYVINIPKNAQPHAIFINKIGFHQLITVSHKHGLDEITKSLNIKTFHRYKRKEIEILDELIIFFDELKLIYLPQYYVQKYRIDLYIPAYHLAIEIDENNHQYRDIQYEQQRESTITKSLNCTFIRCNPDVADFNIYKLIAKIMNYMIVYQTE